MIKPRANEITVRWDDPAIGINRGVANPSLSARDGAAPLLAEVKNLPWPDLMRILLTGTNGQVGGALLPLLRAGTKFTLRDIVNSICRILICLLLRWTVCGPS